MSTLKSSQPVSETKCTNAITPPKIENKFISAVDSKCTKLFHWLPIFHPFGPFKLIWDPILIIVLTISAFEIPFTLAFEINLTFHNTSGILAFIIDIFLCFDILINFRTAYFDKYDNLQLIMCPYYITKRYLKSRFILDFVTSMPLEFMIPAPDGPNVGDYLKILRIIRLIRLLKIARILKLIPVFDRIIKKIFTKREYIIVIKAIKMLLSMLFVAHYFACVWYAIGTLMVSNGHDSWLTEAELDSIEMDDAYLIKYSYSYYWAIITLFTTGYGDITAHNIGEMWIAVICVIIGSCFTAYFIGTLTALVTEGDRLKNFQNEQIEDATAFCEYHKLSDKLLRAVLTHIKYYNTYNFVLCDYESNIMNNLPIYLQKKIQKEMSENTLNQLDIFKHLPSELIGSISLKLKSVSCNRGHFLYKRNDIANKLYIQRTGESLLDYHNRSKNNKNKVRRLKRGDIIGEYSLIQSKRKCSLKCLSFCEFYSLSKKDIKNVIKIYYNSNNQIIQQKWNKIKNKIKTSCVVDRNIELKHNNNEPNVNQDAIVHDFSNYGVQIRSAWNIFDFEQNYKGNSNSNSLSKSKTVTESFVADDPDIDSELEEIEEKVSLKDNSSTNTTKVSTEIELEIVNSNSNQQKKKKGRTRSFLGDKLKFASYRRNDSIRRNKQVLNHYHSSRYDNNYKFTNHDAVLNNITLLYTDDMKDNIDANLSTSHSSYSSQDVGEDDDKGVGETIVKYKSNINKLLDLKKNGNLQRNMMKHISKNDNDSIK